MELESKQGFFPLMAVAGDAGAKGSGDEGIRGRFSDPLYFLLKRRWMTPYGTPVSRESCRGTEGGTEGQVLSKRVWRCNPVSDRI